MAGNHFAVYDVDTRKLFQEEKIIVNLKKIVKQKRAWEIFEQHLPLFPLTIFLIFSIVIPKYNGKEHLPTLQDTKWIVSFIVMLIIALIISYFSLQTIKSISDEKLYNANSKLVTAIKSYTGDLEHIRFIIDRTIQEIDDNAKGFTLVISNSIKWLIRIMGVGVVVSFFQFTMESKGIFGLMWLVDLITVISIFILNIYTYLIKVDYRMKLATQLVVNKKRHSA